MKRAIRTAVGCGIAFAAAALLGVASGLLTFAALGVFAAPAGAWTLVARVLRATPR